LVSIVRDLKFILNIYFVKTLLKTIYYEALVYAWIF
jgi:hypothetical protein